MIARVADEPTSRNGGFQPPITKRDASDPRPSSHHSITPLLHVVDEDEDEDEEGEGEGEGDESIPLGAI